MADGPMVSVVIPTFNQAALLRETLESVFAQTYRDYEILVVDDGSTDETAEMLAGLGERVRVIRQANAGIGAARNRGIAAARGKYVALLDHDDLWRPEKLATQVAYLEAHPECAGASVVYAYSTDPERPVFDVAAVADEAGIVKRPMRVLAEGQVFLMSSSLMFDRAKAAGLRYAERRKCIEDVPFQVKLFARGAFGIAGREIQMIYRWHGENYSGQAEFHYHGIRMLREMTRGGEFAEFGPEAKADWRVFLAHIGRTAAVRQVWAWRRWRGLETYAREFRHQARLGRWRFLALFPLMLVLPVRVTQERWRAGRGR